MVKKKVSRGIVPPVFSYWPPHMDWNRAQFKGYHDEQVTRMNVLADLLGIPNDITRWYALALHLAKKHVPELRDAKPIGAPQKWGEYEKGILAIEVERERERLGGGTVRDLPPIAMPIIRRESRVKGTAVGFR